MGGGSVVGRSREKARCLFDGRVVSCDMCRRKELILSVVQQKKKGTELTPAKPLAEHKNRDGRLWSEVKIADGKTVSPPARLVQYEGQRRGGFGDQMSNRPREGGRGSQIRPALDGLDSRRP